MHYDSKIENVKFRFNELVRTVSTLNSNSRNVSRTGKN